jgi:hypothetical protein
VFSVTLTVANSGPGAVSIIADIDNTYAAELLQASASPGVQMLRAGECVCGGDCGSVTGFRTSLASGGVALLSLTLRVARPPGAVFTMTADVGADPPTASGFKSTSLEITVAGAGDPALAPSHLIEGARTTAGIDPFGAHTVVFDPIHQLHVAAGADLLSNVVATMYESGVPVGSPYAVAFASGVMPQPWSANIDVAYSAQLAATTSGAGVMVAWSDLRQIRTQTLSGLAMGLPGTLLGNGEAPRIVYSATAREFLVVWIDFGVSRWRLWARRVALDGRPVGATIDLSDASESQPGQLDLTWDPATNEYGVAYVRLLPVCCRSTIELARIRADGTILTRTQVSPGVRSDELRVAVNSRTGEYILIWRDIDGTFAAEMSASGRVVSLGRIADDAVGGYSSLAFNPASGTFLTTGGTANGVLQLRELNQYGTPLSPPTTSTQLVDGVISSPPPVSNWRVFGHFTSAGATNVFTFASEPIGTRSVDGGSQARVGGCMTPDPFVAFGGGVCFDAGWLPPGVAAPGTTITYMGGCSTPDPFVAFGGGTCANGGWHPAAPAAPAPPPVIADGCVTPDPFVAFGGGTCADGGWYPPAAAAPAPPPVPGGCITPDPFVAFGGGICANGGWYPPAAAAPAPPPVVPGGCITPDPFVAFGGGICANGGWTPRH